MKRLNRSIDPYLILLAAAVALATVLPARGGYRSLFDAATYGAVMLLFCLYGTRLSAAAVWQGLIHWRLQLLVFGTTYLLFPIIGTLLAIGLRGHLDRPLVDGMIFLCVLPSTVQSSIAFTSIARGNVAASLCSASVSNLIGVILTPLLLALLLRHASGGLSLAALQDIALQLLLPFLVGQLARPLVGAWLQRHQIITQVVDRGSILLIVYAAFSAGMVAGVWTRIRPFDLALVLLLDVAILLAVLVWTTFASRACGFRIEEEIAVVFCGSKKSMASGIPMANILFPASAVGQTVLPLMLFHQIQLFVCAALARRYAGRRGDGGDPAPRPAVAPAQVTAEDAGARPRHGTRTHKLFPPAPGVSADA